jgi:hypothetical protein
MGGKHPQPATRRGNSNTKEAHPREAAQFNRVVSEGPIRPLESRTVCRPSGYNLLHYLRLESHLTGLWQEGHASPANGVG